MCGRAFRIEVEVYLGNLQVLLQPGSQLVLATQEAQLNVSAGSSGEPHIRAPILPESTSMHFP